MPFKGIFFIFLILLSTSPVFGQAGLYAGFSVIGQQTNIFNADDMRSNSFYTYPGYKIAPSISFTYNYDDRFGLKTGMIYSPIRQIYRGSVTDSTGLVSTRFESHVQLNYLKVPIMFQFNSQFGPDKTVNLSIAAGFLLNFLRDVSYANDFSEDISTPDIRLSSLYNSFGTSFATQVHLNFFISENSAIIAGAHLERGIGNIDNKDVILPDDMPLELYHPVSVPKESRPNLKTRLASKVVTVGLFVGLNYRIATVGED